MRPDADAGGGQGVPSLSISEIRDYQKLNAELVTLLDEGHPFVRLEGAEGQRLLASGLSGPWNAVVEIVGRTGPEVAAGLEAPGLTVIATGPTADGAARGLKAGRVLILGDAGDSTGYAQAGGLLVVAGAAGHRTGLMQSGGCLAILGPTGRLAGDRQSGGWLFVPRRHLGPHEGRGRRGGRLIEFPDAGEVEPETTTAWRSVVELASGRADPRSFPPP